MRLCKRFFGLRADVKYLFSYASPINSPHTQSKSTNILEQLETRHIDNNTIIMGDLNGRTKTKEDFIRDKNDKHSPINRTLAYTKDDPLHERQNLDTHHVDEQGKLILALCKNASMRILNGRTRGDYNGNFTRYPSKISDNPSTIDYTLCSTNLIKEIISFSVLPFSGLSDH